MLTGRCYSVEMDKHKILADAKAELERHVWSGRKGVGCTWRYGCNRLRLRSLPQEIRNEQSILAVSCR